MFVKLCNRAFTPRDFHGIPFFKNFAFLHHHSFYKTRPFEAALQEAFGSGFLFHNGRGYASPRTRVAVTSATASGDKAVVIANYNRSRGGEEGKLCITDPLGQYTILLTNHLKGTSSKDLNVSTMKWRSGTQHGRHPRRRNTSSRSSHRLPRKSTGTERYTTTIPS